MDALSKFLGWMLPSQKEPPARDNEPDNLTQDQVTYLRELADQERRSWALNKKQA
jgi:hypothetical protein